MIRIRSFMLASLLLAVSPMVFATGPGAQYCFGIGCPCGNDDPNGGCANSTGEGARLDATGSASITADDAVFNAIKLPKNCVSILIAGKDQSAFPFRDGIWCLGSGAHRLEQHLNSGSSGSVSFTGIVQRLEDVFVEVQPGDNWHFQVWFRDAPAKQSPCGKKHNLTNGYSIQYTL